MGTGSLVNQRILTGNAPGVMLSEIPHTTQHLVYFCIELKEWFHHNMTCNINKLAKSSQFDARTALPPWSDIWADLSRSAHLVYEYDWVVKTGTGPIKTTR